MKLPRKVLILGSGGLKIGQAGEFDYSGSQAIKAFREAGIKIVLLNPNIATVQTDSDMADEVYFLPLNAQTVKKILKIEQPDAVVLSFGGQTALNLGLELDADGTWQRFGVGVLGTSTKVIKTTEDRQLFKQALDAIDVKTAQSQAVDSVQKALLAAKRIGYPVMMRSGFSLGGLGSGRVASPDELKKRAEQALAAVPQILIEEYLSGWKEVEYEVVRDFSGNAITVCNMENFDPMGIHTGESIVVAPSQTLTNDEYHKLRAVSLKTISSLGIIGECNIQFALDPKTSDYRVIEVNARLSRSSALASKATGYPLAYVAAKLILGWRLDELKNSVTGSTPAFFEPALDYLAVKMPRWDLTKLKTSDRTIGSEMKSVGEVMALGRSFPEALQKAVRMLNIGCDGLTSHPYEFSNPRHEIQTATDRRLFAIYESIKRGASLQQIHRLSGIDEWFLGHIKAIADQAVNLKSNKLTPSSLAAAKQMGFSDAAIARKQKTSAEKIRKLRLRHGIRPVIKQIDTLAGEFAARTNYLYTTYHGQTDDVRPLSSKAVIILGSGPYCIGSSVEFDWSAVNTAKTLQKMGHRTIIINSNPETVSTDFDRSDRLYFEELSLERVQDIADFENQPPIVVSVGGQIPNNLALPLADAGYKLLGTAAESIDRAENRQKFSSMLNKLKIDQPDWAEADSMKAAENFAKKVGYPVLIRPSYVLSGGAMNVVTSKDELHEYLQAATRLSPEHPVVISKFITDAKELEIDGVARDGQILIYAISEHIENAGVHSGDATIVLPPQRLYLETIRRAREIAKAVIGELKITGPFNIQFIAIDNELKVIECNVRASRSLPFASKVTGHNFVEIATEALMGINNDNRYQTLDLDHVGVKSPQFSYNRLKGADPVAGVEMASTGEVACIGGDLLEAFFESWQAAGQAVNGKRLFLSLPDKHKPKITAEAEALQRAGWTIYATAGTAGFLNQRGIRATRLYKISEGRQPSLAGVIEKRRLDLVISVPRDLANGDDAYAIRRLAIDNHLPLITNAEIAKLLLKCLAELDDKGIAARSWRSFMAHL